MNQLNKVITEIIGIIGGILYLFAPTQNFLSGVNQSYGFLFYLLGLLLILFSILRRHLSMSITGAILFIYMFVILAVSQYNLDTDFIPDQLVTGAKFAFIGSLLGIFAPFVSIEIKRKRKEENTLIHHIKQKEGVIFCTQCGTKNESSSKFCIECGSKME